MKPYIFTLLIVLVFTGQLSAQKAKGYPRAYDHPLDLYISGQENKLTNSSNWSDQDKRRAWLVFTDRENVKAYAEASESSVVKKVVPFATPLYVVKTDGNWIKVVKAKAQKLTLSSVEEIGWIKKGELLLWHNSLVNARTKINLKAVLLNKFDNLDAIPCEETEIVQVFTDPRAKTTLKKVNIYQFYFVYKIEGGRYLLASDPRLNSLDPAILGWVSEERLSTWNTRVALEPNYDQAAYDERKSNNNLKITGFKNYTVTKNYAKTGDKSGKVWSNDPVDLPSSERAVTDNNRYGSRQMRFPLLTVGNSKGGEESLYFRSAVLDEVLVKKGCGPDGNIRFDRISPTEMGEVLDRIDKYKLAATNFNIVLVFEAGERMKPYQEAMANLAGEINRHIILNRPNANVRFGAVSYGDIGESAVVDELVKTKSLTSQSSKVASFIRNLDFSNVNSSGNAPVQRYALAQAIKSANFSPYHTNILVVVGRKGDYSSSRLLNMKYKSSKANVDNTALIDAVNAANVNILGFQCEGGGTIADKAFATELRAVMLQAATKNVNNQLRKDRLDPRLVKKLEENGYSFDGPSMDDPDLTSEPTVTLKNGTLRGTVTRITSNQAMLPNDLAGRVNRQVAEIVDANILKGKKLEEWKYGDMNVPGFSIDEIRIANEMYKTGGNVESWVEEKFNLYKPLFFARQPVGANYPSFKFVLFYTRNDLSDYIADLQNFINVVDGKGGGERRRALKEAYCELINQFTGEDSDQDCEDYTIEEVNAIMQGVEKEGVSFSGNYIALKDITQPAIVTDEAIDQMIDKFVSVKKKLVDIRDGNNYEFKFTHGNTSFYWVDAAEVF